MSDVEGPADEINRLPLKALGLKPGMALQTRRLVEGASKKEAQYFGAIEGKGVMVGPLGTEGDRTELEPGEVCVVRGFTGQYEFSFLSKVLQTFEKPFVYALLGYPAKVDTRLVRQSMRTKVSWPCSVRLQSSAPDSAPIGAALVDLSNSGAMIRSATSVAAIGSQISLVVHAQLDGEPAELVVNAKICHNNRAAYEDAYFIGLAFIGLKAFDRQLLNVLTSSPGSSE